MPRFKCNGYKAKKYSQYKSKLGCTISAANSLSCRKSIEPLIKLHLFIVLVLYVVAAVSSFSILLSVQLYMKGSREKRPYTIYVENLLDLGASDPNFQMAVLGKNYHQYEIQKYE